MSDERDRDRHDRHNHSRRPNVVKEFFTNWREYDADVGTKLRLTFANRARALRRGCCGNHGQPGC